MKEYGPPSDPFPELPPAATLYDVHWRKGGPPETHLRLVMGLTSSSSGGDAHGTWDTVESGTESGSVLLLWPGFGRNDAYGIQTLTIASYSGSRMFASSPTKYISVSPGAAWVITLTLDMALPVGSIGGAATATVTVHSIDENGAPNGTLATLTGEVEPGDSTSISMTATGVAPT